MSASPDPRFTPAAQSDEALLEAHEKLLGRQPDSGGHYSLMPLGLLFLFSGLILFAATYLNRYSGHYAPTVFNENSVPSSGEAEVKVDPVAMGKRLFNTPGACVQCHQAAGTGMPGVYPPLAGSEWAQGPADRVIHILLYGLQGPITVEGKSFGTAVMPAFGSAGFNWSDDKIAAVLTYVRQEWGNKGGPITADQVQAVRSKAGNRAAMTAAELEAIK
ncbi:MAG TPA: cytochrome c [Opitutaceae bacterium]|nr:cytochrome c [Opitutaceae bacterium]